MSSDLLFLIAFLSSLIFIASLGLWLTVKPRRKRSNWARLDDALYYWLRGGMRLRDAIERAWGKY